MTSATEVLRRLLDERGVEHYDGTERTLWGYEQTGEDTGIYRFAASEISGGFLQFDMFRITPEQAIAATLGSCNCSDNCTNGERTETCHNVWDTELTGRLRFQCSNCGAVSLEITPNYCPICGRRIEQ